MGVKLLLHALLPLAIPERVAPLIVDVAIVVCCCALVVVEVTTAECPSVRLMDSNSCSVVGGWPSPLLASSVLKSTPLYPPP